MHEKSIELLNRAAADELAAVHQYMYFHFHCDDQGYDLLAGLFRQTAIEEMLHILRAARAAVLAGRFTAWRREFHQRYTSGEAAEPLARRAT